MTATRWFHGHDALGANGLEHVRAGTSRAWSASLRQDDRELVAPEPAR
jgi:hypothetical protein